MKRTNYAALLFSCAGMLVLILDGQTARTGAVAGIDLCIRTVIPSLFPFFIFSLLLTGSLSNISFSVLNPLEKWSGIPSGAAPILLTGFLGGYPTGAQCIASAWKAGCLKKQDAERMLAFCNNAGPAFLFGMIGPLFSSPVSAVALWGIHILSALLTASIIKKDSETESIVPPRNKTSLSEIMQTSLRAMATVCGWIIVFRVVLAFLDRWFLWMLPEVVQVLFTGLLELSNGCCRLVQIEWEDLRFVIASCMLSAGGICITMQTFSAADGLSLRYYIPGKILQTILSLIISICIVLRIWYLALPLLLIPPILQKSQKRSGNPRALGV